MGMVVLCMSSFKILKVQKTTMGSDNEFLGFSIAELMSNWCNICSKNAKMDFKVLN